MGLSTGVQAGVSVIGSVAGAVGQQSAASKQARAQEYQSYIQARNAERQHELTMMDIEQQRAYTDRVYEIGQQNRTLDAIQNKADYKKAMMQIQDGNRQQKLQLDQAAAASGQMYRDQLAALNKYDSTLRRQYRTANFQLKEELYNQEMQAKAEYELGKQNARITAAQESLGLRREFVEGNHQYKTTRHNLIMQAQGASAQNQQVIAEQIATLDQMAMDAQSAMDAMAAQGMNGEAGQAATAAQAARMAMQGNAQIASMTDQDLTTYLSQTKIADLTGQLGMTEEELHTALGINQEALDQELGHLETMYDLFNAYMPAIAQHAQNAQAAGYDIATNESQYARDMLGLQEQMNQRGYAAGKQMSNYNAQMAGRGTRIAFKGSKQSARLNQYMDKLNNLYAHSSLDRQAAASESNMVSAVAGANAQAQAAQSRVPGVAGTFLNMVPGLAQAGGQVYTGLQTDAQTTYTAPGFLAPTQQVQGPTYTYRR